MRRSAGARGFAARPRRCPSRGRPSRACASRTQRPELSGSCSAAIEERDHEERREQDRHADDRAPDVRIDPEVRGDDVHAARPADREGRLEAEAARVLVRSEERRRRQELGSDARRRAGTKIEISRTTPRMITLQMSQPRMCSLNAGGPAARTQPERDRDALEADQQVVPADEDARGRSGRSRRAGRRSGPASRSRSGSRAGHRWCSRRRRRARWR